MVVKETHWKILYNMRIGIVGWVGRGNAGDDAMAAAFITSLRRVKPEAEFFALADKAKLGVELDHLQLKGQPFFNAISKIPILRSFLVNAIYSRFFIGRGLDALIIGGGSIFRHEKVIKGYHRLVQRSRSKNLGTKIGVASVSIGPFETENAEKQCACFLNSIDFAIVRDERSLEVAKRLAPNLKIESFPDVALTYAAKANSSYTTKGIESVRRIPTFAVCLRAGERLDMQSGVIDWLSKMTPDSCRISFIAMSNNPDYDDQSFAEGFSSRFTHLDIEFHSYDGDLQNTLRLLRSCDAVVAVRLHALIFATALRKPVFFLPYQKKLQDFADDSGLNSIVEVPKDLSNYDAKHIISGLAPPDDEAWATLKRRSEYALTSLKKQVFGTAEYDGQVFLNQYSKNEKSGR